MSDAEDAPRDRFTGRLWCGVFGAFIGGILGLVLAGWLQGSLIVGVLLGALVCGLLAFAFGLGALEFIYYV